MVDVVDPYVTASMLYNMVACEHRVYCDVFADPSSRDPVHPFVEWLWRHGNDFESETLAGGGEPVTDLRGLSREERETETIGALERGDSMIYGARIVAGDLVGEPDVLRAEGSGYVPIDVKSGAGTEDDGGSGKPKAHYAMQLALYVDVLERIGASSGRRAYVWDRYGSEVLYDLSAPKSPKNTTTLWDDYLQLVDKARAILREEFQTSAASSSICKMCHWQTNCLKELTANDDLTLLPEMGRSRRDPLLPYVSTIHEFASAHMNIFLDEKGRCAVKGFSQASLSKFHARAKLRDGGGGAYAKEPVTLASSEIEVVLDIENHPFRDHCYLHGIMVRRSADDVLYEAFLSASPNADSERQAFAEAWNYLSGLQSPQIYTYSKHERTWWRRLQERHPDVCTLAEVDALFQDAIDLYYGVILPKTEWPTNDFSLKTLATYLGFTWRAEDPSGAASIVWYDEYLAGDGEALARLVAYNEDDCRATFRLIDALRALPVVP